MTPLNPIKQPDTQLRVLAILVGSGFAVLLAGLWYVQVFSSKKFAESLEDQAVRSVRLPAVRGKIPVIVIDSGLESKAAASCTNWSKRRPRSSSSLNRDR